MIVLDDQLSSAQITAAIERWSPSAVISVRRFRPHGQLLDPNIPACLLQLHQPTFVTINYDDFWRPQMAHARYCLVCLKLEQGESQRVPEVLRSVLSLSEFRTKRHRMGKIISWRDGKVSYFSV